MLHAAHILQAVLLPSLTQQSWPWGQDREEFLVVPAGYVAFIHRLSIC